MTYLFTFLLDDLALLAVGPSVASRAYSRHVVLERTNAADIARLQSTPRRGPEGTTRGAREGSRSGGGGSGGRGGGRGRRHFHMKKKEKKRVLPGESTGLYIHINAG